MSGELPVRLPPVRSTSALSVCLLFPIMCLVLVVSVVRCALMLFFLVVNIMLTKVLVSSLVVPSPPWVLVLSAVTVLMLWTLWTGTLRSPWWSVMVLVIVPLTVSLNRCFRCAVDGLSDSLASRLRWSTLSRSLL